MTNIGHASVDFSTEPRQLLPIDYCSEISLLKRTFRAL
jgi:hypothetical protein